MAARKSSYRPRTRNAVILIDYTNVFGVISERIDNDQPDAVVLDLVTSLKRHVSEHLNLRPVRTLAFANLPPGTMRGHRATGAWLAQGIEPHLCYARSRDEAAAIELAMEAMKLSAEMGPGTAFVVLSGNQWFVPLVQRLFRSGHFVLMATLESPSAQDDLPADCQDLYLSADFLLGGPGRKLDLASDQDEDSEGESQRPTETVAITDTAVLKTLGIIESYFGQYEEIYLTPLLRKLSEIIDDPDEEPKVLINDLEQVGAVWLEKRRGFPHNYTVLLMNMEHPDVAEIKESSLTDSDEYASYDDDHEDQSEANDDYYDDSDGNYDDDDDEYPSD
ncbi:MAG: NYN domain-containing protein [Rhodothermales bacterium]